MTATAAPDAKMPEYFYGRPQSRTATLDEERREVYQSVRESLRSAAPDPDRVAACSYLLRHLAATGSSRYDGFRQEGVWELPRRRRSDSVRSDKLA